MIRSDELFAERYPRRDRIQVLADIVTVCSEPTKLTRILRLANVQYNFFKKAMETLREAGIMESTSTDSRDERTRFEFEATDVGISWRNFVHLVYIMLDSGNDFDE